MIIEKVLTKTINIIIRDDQWENIPIQILIGTRANIVRNSNPIELNITCWRLTKQCK